MYICIYSAISLAKFLSFTCIEFLLLTNLIPLRYTAGHGKFRADCDFKSDNVFYRVLGGIPTSYACRGQGITKFQILFSGVKGSNGYLCFIGCSINLIIYFLNKSYIVPCTSIKAMWCYELSFHTKFPLAPLAPSWPFRYRRGYIPFKTGYIN